MDILETLGYEKVRTKVTTVVKDKFAKAREVFKQMQEQLPEVKPVTLKHGIIAYCTMGILGTMVSSTIGTYVFFGTVTLASFVAIIESSKYSKYMISRSNRLVDFTLFGATLWATASLGITVSAALTFAGLGYTLIYAPYLREKFAKQQMSVA